MATSNYEDLDYLEKVYAALFAKLKTATFAGGLKMNQFQRVTVVPDEVDATNQPALIQLQEHLTIQQKENFGPAKWQLRIYVLVYLRADGANADQVQELAATVTNYVIWGLAKVLETTLPPYQKQTLDGLVYHCWLEGDVVPEILDQQVVIVVPVNILLGPN